MYVCAYIVLLSESRDEGLLLENVCVLKCMYMCMYACIYIHICTISVSLYAEPCEGGADIFLGKCFEVSNSLQYIHAWPEHTA
jgi:hypothetical protein